MLNEPQNNYREYTWHKPGGFLLAEYEIKKEGKIIALMNYSDYRFVAEFKGSKYSISNYQLYNEKGLIAKLLDIHLTEYYIKIGNNEYTYLKGAKEIVTKDNALVIRAQNDRLFFPVSGTLKVNYNKDVPALLTCFFYLNDADTAP
ncbi:MAG: hypothetical protein H0W73_06155 [Bacteroidetes bacterium]|nr:hypothetical protein [Bacteroidota bacterium]